MMISTFPATERQDVDSSSAAAPQVQSQLCVGLLTMDPANEQYVRRLAARRNVRLVAGRRLAELPLGQIDAVIWDLDQLGFFGDPLSLLGRSGPAVQAVQAVVTYRDLEAQNRRTAPARLYRSSPLATRSTKRRPPLPPRRPTPTSGHRFGVRGRSHRLTVLARRTITSQLKKPAPAAILLVATPDWRTLDDRAHTTRTHHQPRRLRLALAAFGDPATGLLSRGREPAGHGCRVAFARPTRRFHSRRRTGDRLAAT